MAVEAGGKRLSVAVGGLAFLICLFSVVSGWNGFFYHSQIRTLKPETLALIEDLKNSEQTSISRESFNLVFEKNSAPIETANILSGLYGCLDFVISQRRINVSFADIAEAQKVEMKASMKTPYFPGKYTRCADSYLLSTAKLNRDKFTSYLGLKIFYLGVAFLTPWIIMRIIFWFPVLKSFSMSNLWLLAIPVTYLVCTLIYFSLADVFKPKQASDYAVAEYLFFLWPIISMLCGLPWFKMTKLPPKVRVPIFVLYVPFSMILLLIFFSVLSGLFGYRFEL
jgi:hypothetical protein